MFSTSPRKLFMSFLLITGLAFAKARDRQQQEIVWQYGTIVWQEQFDDPTTSRVFPEINVDRDIDPFYCDEVYTPAKCPIPAEWNPWQQFMGRPEFKPSDVPNRVVSVKSGQFFGFYRVIHGGFQKQVATTPGARYRLSFDGQIWNAENAEGGCTERNADNYCIKRLKNQPFTSDIASEGDRTAAYVYAAYDPTCGANAFASTVQRGPNAGYSYQDRLAGDNDRGSGVYDQFERVWIEFTATGSCTTVFAGGWNKFAKTHNDFYIDNMVLEIVTPPTATAFPSATSQPTLQATGQMCIPTIVTATPDPNAVCVWITPSPIGTQVTPSLTALPQPTGTSCTGCSKEERWYTVNTSPGFKLNVRAGAGTTFPVVRQYERDRPVFIQCVKLVNGFQWGSEQVCGLNTDWMMMQYLKL